MDIYHEGYRHEQAQVFRVVGVGKDRYKRLCLDCWDNMHGSGRRPLYLDASGRGIYDDDIPF